MGLTHELGKGAPVCFALYWCAAVGAWRCSRGDKSAALAGSTGSAPQLAATKPVVFAPAASAVLGSRDGSTARVPHPLAVQWAESIESHLVYAVLRRVDTFRLYRLQETLVGIGDSEISRYHAGQLSTPVALKMTDGDIGRVLMLSGHWPGWLFGIVGPPPNNYGYVPPEIVVAGPSPHSLRSTRHEMLPAIWSQGRTLVLNQNAQFDVISGNKDLLLPQIPLRNGTGCATVFVPVAFDASPDGRVLAVGPSCERPGTLDVGTWERDEVEAIVQPLPSSHRILPPDTCSTATCPGWRRLADSPGRLLFRVFLGPKGINYVLAQTDKESILWHTKAGGWETVSLPVKPDPWSVNVDSQARFWMVSSEWPPRLVRLEGDTWRGISLPSESTVRNHLDAPNIGHSFSTCPTSVVDHEGLISIGAEIVDIHADRVETRHTVSGLAVLELGPAVHDAGSTALSGAGQERAARENNAPKP